MARITQLVDEIAWSHAPNAVGAVGQCDVYPNSRNIIPGKVVFTIDFRAPEQKIIDDMDEFADVNDLDEPYSDYNQNGMFDAGLEVFSDANLDNEWSIKDGLWNGVNCQHSTLCSEQESADLGIQLTLHLADSRNPTICNYGDFPQNHAFSVSTESETTFSGMFLSDGNSSAENDIGGCSTGNALPNGTTVGFSAESGSIKGTSSWVIRDDATLPTGAYRARYSAPTQAGTDTLTLTITVPGEDSVTIEWIVTVN